jgi:ribosomal protein S18 acetylase RimI-like enzyme
MIDDVRAARAQDLTAVLELWAHERSEHAITSDRFVDVERLINDTPGALLVAEAEGEIIGALIAAWDGWRGNMYRLAVRSDHRRRGIALQLVRAGEQYLRSRGARRVTALVAYDDESAASFWEHAGYPRDHVIGRTVRDL